MYVKSYDPKPFDFISFFFFLLCLGFALNMVHIVFFANIFLMEKKLPKRRIWLCKVSRQKAFFLL